MKNKLAYLYQIKVINIVEVNEKIFKVITPESNFILKKVDSLNKENIYIRLQMTKLNFFSLPIKSINDRYVEEIDHEYYILSYYFKDENLSLNEVRMSFYLKAIGHLHLNSSYPLKVNDGYFIESLNYIENKIIKVREEIEQRMYNIEHQEYHSPSSWYFISCYQIFNNALNESQKYLDLLNEEFEKLNSVELTLTYQNFSLDHIIIKEEKIISLEKMNIAPPVYDLVDFIEKNYNEKIDISVLLNNYFGIYQYNLYQKYWLLSLLYIPKVTKQISDFNDIEDIYLSVNYLKLVEKIKSSLLKQTEEE